MLKTLPKIKNKFKKSKSGFTLIELIVVIAVLAILAVVLVPLIIGQTNKARNSANQSDAQAIFTACQKAQIDLEQANTTLTNQTGGTVPSSILGETALETVYTSGSSKWKNGITSVTMTISNHAVTSITTTAANGQTYTYPN